MYPLHKQTYDIVEAVPLATYVISHVDIASYVATY